MSRPQHCPSQRELDDLELLVSGALAPLTAYDVPGSPVTLVLPPDLAAEPTVELVDPEGLPLALVHLEDDGSRRVEALAHAEHGPFRRSVELGADVVAEEARASYEDGMLVVDVPLARRDEGARRVPIEDGRE